MGDAIRLRRDEGWSEITIHRPEALNALNRSMMNALLEMLGTLAEDGADHSVVLTGSGDRAFAAGADLLEMNALEAADLEELVRVGQAVAGSLEQFPVPVIAAVNGYALGGGCELALACDRMICADTAIFGLPEVTLGILPGWGGTQRLERRVGFGLAREMIFTGRRMGAEEAVTTGLADELVPLVTLMEAARTFTGRLAAVSRPSLVAAKAAVAASRGGDGYTLEARLFGELFPTQERVEAMGRFLKRG